MNEKRVSPSVRVLLSFDYCHFEVALASDQPMTLKETNELRKDAMRLADEAVRQYKVAKEKAQSRNSVVFERERLQADVDRIQNIPAKEWTAEQKAKVKALDDINYWSRHDYNYDDDEDGRW